MYCVGEYYQKGENATSLTVQHVDCVDRNMEVVFGCVCTGLEADYVTEQLLEWFCREGLEQCAAGGEQKQLQQDLDRHLQEICHEYEEYRKRLAGRGPDIISGMSGILCAGEDMLLFGHGGQKIYLCNRYFDRPHIRCIAGREKAGKERFCQYVRGEAGIVILLATSPFYKRLTEQMLRECLEAKELKTAEGMERRLRELGNMAADKGAEHMGAILLRKTDM